MIDDEIFDMDDALEEFERLVLVKTIVGETSTDFVKTQLITGREQDCVVQPANPAKLKIDNVDASKAYMLIHSRVELKLYEYVEYNGKDYKIITPADWSGYGFNVVVGEETNKPLLVVNS